MSRQPNDPAHFDFDLGAVFQAAVDFGRAVYNEPAGSGGEVTTRARLLAALNPRRRMFGTDPQFRVGIAHPWICLPSDTPNHFDEVDLSLSLPSDDARNALKTIAAATILLTGEELQRVRGRELLGSGAWLLWQGMGEVDRARVISQLSVATRLWRWSQTPSGVPASHSGPTHTEVSGLGHIDLSGWRWQSREALHADIARSQAEAQNQYHHGLLPFNHVYTSGTQAVQVSGLSCKVILGSEPSLCPDADPPLPPTMLPELLLVFQPAITLPDGVTLHWVGHNAGLRNRCRCHPNAPSAAPADRDRWPVPVVKPDWDRSLRQLRYGVVVIRNYSKKRAENQEQLLDAFQQAGWETTVTAPIEGRALKEAIDAFNDTVEPNTIRLRRDGTAKGVSWLPAPRAGSTRT